MIRLILAATLCFFVAQPLAAQTAAETPPSTDAFERAFAVSLYQFDACGDPLAGRMYRRALAERFAQCPFPPDARTRYQQRTRAQQAKVRNWMETLIETRGGLPVKLDGMSTTCHAQQSTEAYQAFRARLEQYTQGNLPAAAIVAGACDAADLAP